MACFIHEILIFEQFKFQLKKISWKRNNYIWLRSNGVFKSIRYWNSVIKWIEDSIDLEIFTTFLSFDCLFNRIGAWKVDYSEVLCQSKITPAQLVVWEFKWICLLVRHEPTHTFIMGNDWCSMCHQLTLSHVVLLIASKSGIFHTRTQTNTHTHTDTCSRAHFTCSIV